MLDKQAILWDIYRSCTTLAQSFSEKTHSTAQKKKDKKTLASWLEKANE